MIGNNITKKQQEILTVITRFRFLDRTHLQYFLHHKDKQQINRWLKDLTEKEYIRRIYDNRIIGENRIPGIYSLALNGIRYINFHHPEYGAALHKLYFEKNRSETFIQHRLLTATICCQLEKKNSNTLLYEYTTESDYSPPDSPHYFLKDLGLVVDLCFSKKRKGENRQWFLLMIFDATLPRYRIRKRMRDYTQFYFNNEWESKTGVLFPAVLLIFQTKERMIYAKRYTKMLFADDSLSPHPFHFAIAQSVKTEGITGGMWE